MNRLAALKFDASPGHADVLAFLADEVHLDAVTFRIIEGTMGEIFQVEISTELAIDTSQEIEIELCSQPGPIVVGSMKRARVFHQIDPHNQGCAVSQHAPGVAQEGHGF